jgi:diguanylate cyclase (GGDEF)-like protein
MNRSLYSLLVSQHAAEIAPMRCTEQMLGRLIRHMDDLVVENGLSAVVIRGRCLNGNAAEEVKRFYRLSAAVRRHYIFACGPNCLERTWTIPTFPGSSVLQRGDFHEVDQGPFVLIVDPRFSGLIASTRVADGDNVGEGNAFEMVWTFDPNVVYTALEYLVARVSAQHRDDAREFESQVRHSAPSSASLRLTLTFTTKLAIILQRQTEMETATSRISALVNSTFEISAILQGAVDQIAKSLGVRRVALAVWDEERLMPEAIHEAVAPKDAQARQPETLIALPTPIEVPVSSRGRTLGVLTVEDDTPFRTWCEEELTMVHTVAHHLGIGISHARLFKQTEEQAITDDLTGLYNKRHLMGRLDREMQVAARSGQPVSVILLDLDNLKAVNDTFGHIVGDSVIRRMGEVVRAHVRTIDIAARFGGEEFVVVLPFTDLDGALLAAERLREALEDEPIEMVGTVTASVGVTTYPGSAANALSVLAEADQAMYAAKTGGRNRVVAYGDRVAPPDADDFWLRDNPS